MNRNQPQVAGEAEGATPEKCPVPEITRKQEIIDNVPYLLMLALGAAVLAVALNAPPWRWVWASAYVAYGVIGAFWIMIFMCPYCHFYDTRLCPCGYGQIAARLRPRRDGDLFARQFRRHIPVIVPLWFIPPIVAGVVLMRSFSWTLLALVLLFVANSFIVLPLISRMYGCAECPQKQDCPWMGGCKGPA